MNKKIEDETVIYVKIPRDKVGFASKEAETMYDLSLKNDWFEKENQELKKQLEETKNLLKEVLAQVQDTDDAFSRERGFMQYKINGYKTQQKEFIKYLEDEIHSCEAVSNLLFNSNKEMKVYKEILQKYREIIGVSDEKK